MVVTPAEFLRLALDPVRLAVLGRAVGQAVDVEELAATLDVRTRVVREAVGKLRSAGLLDDSQRLETLALRRLAESLPQAPPLDLALTAGMWSPEETEILGRFFAGSRLTSIPAHHSKRRIILERLVQEFEPGVRYSEAEINFTLQLFHQDYASLRRHLVDEGMMTRAEGVYWRTGGRYEPGTERVPR